MIPYPHLASLAMIPLTAIVCVWISQCNLEHSVPVPTAATRLMVETFQEVTEKQNTGLARCMSLIHICERFRLTHEEQLKAIFKVNRDDLCKGKK